MKKPLINNPAANRPDELKIYRQSSTVAKKPTYIYTEEDLGEGILDAGISG